MDSSPGDLPRPVYERFGITVHPGDCRDVLPGLPDSSVDAVVTDPPYELGFMGKGWDSTGVAYDVDMWRQCLRVLKPGGHLLAFGGTRTWHRLVCAVEDAGFEIRDSIAWLYATGFPKSLDVSKAIDKAAGAEREVVGAAKGRRCGVFAHSGSGRSQDAASYASADVPTAAATADAVQWQGWGTALKPAFEPIVVARKPFVGTVAGNVLEYDTGALNIDGCRVGDPEDKRAAGTKTYQRFDPGSAGKEIQHAPHDGKGRWPTNVVLTHAATPDGVDLCGDGCIPGCVVADLDRQSGITTSPSSVTRGGKRNEAYGMARQDHVAAPGDSGGASRFFPVFRFEAKAPGSERPRVDGVAHPTVKPLALLRWLVRLVTPPRGTVLDPFAGTGVTGQACRAENMACILIERDAESMPLIRARLDRQPGRSGHRSTATDPVPQFDLFSDDPGMHP